MISYVPLPSLKSPLRVGRVILSILDVGGWIWDNILRAKALLIRNKDPRCDWFFFHILIYLYHFNLSLNAWLILVSKSRLGWGLNYNELLCLRVLILDDPRWLLSCQVVRYLIQILRISLNKRYMRSTRISYYYLLVSFLYYSILLNGLLELLVRDDWNKLKLLGFMVLSEILRVLWVHS